MKQFCKISFYFQKIDIFFQSFHNTFKYNYASWYFLFFQIRRAHAICQDFMSTRHNLAT